MDTNFKHLNRMRNILSTLFAFLLVTSVYGQGRESFIQGGFRYSIDRDGDVYVSDAGSDVAVPLSEDGTLVIPSSVEHEGITYRVRFIDDGAFACMPEVRHVIISEGLEQFFRNSFYRCTRLESIHFPSTFRTFPELNEFLRGCCNLRRITVDERNERFDSRDDCNAIIYSDEDKLIFGCPGTRIPSTVTAIDFGAFAQCEKLESIVIPEGVRVIEPCAFRNCANLRAVSLPNSLEGIGYSVFSGCMSLESVFIPQNVKEVRGYGSFYAVWNLFGGCYNLREVRVDKRNRTFDSRNGCNALVHTATDVIVAACGASVIDKSIRGIGDFAFAHSSIQRIRIPKGVRRIGRSAFWMCEACNDISVDPRNPVYNSKDNCNAIIETATGRLMHGCRLTRIPDNVREIGDSAFYGVRLPSHLIIPEGVETIGTHAFTRFCGLEYVKMPSTLRLIKENAFAHCDDLNYIDMSLCSPKAEEFAFAGCKHLNMVDFSPAMGDIHQLSFSGCPCEKRVEAYAQRVTGGLSQEGLIMKSKKGKTD